MGKIIQDLISPAFALYRGNWTPLLTKAGMNGGMLAPMWLTYLWHGEPDIIRSFRDGTFAVWRLMRTTLSGFQRWGLACANRVQAYGNCLSPGSKQGNAINMKILNANNEKQKS